ncbi:MAG: preprotein translocase subunit SecY [Terracidiphilus sp.]|jgi:preprotein translocase subunit SecY
MFDAESFLNIFRVRSVRSRLLFTLFMLAVYRLGRYIPIPGVDIRVWDSLWSGTSNSALGFIDTIAAGNIKSLSIFALGGLASIQASLIVLMGTLVHPRLRRARVEGELGRRKIAHWNLWVAVVLTFLFSLWASQRLIFAHPGVVIVSKFNFVVMATISLTAGSALISWISEQITERGIGDGSSMLIFMGIVTKLPEAIATIYGKLADTHAWSLITLFFVIAVIVVSIMLIVLVQRSERRIPIQSEKRIVGRRMMGGQSPHMPLAINPGGAKLMIVALVLMTSPMALIELFGTVRSKWMMSALEATQAGEPLYYLLLPVLLIILSLLYVWSLFNPKEFAEDLIKRGNFIPGIRPGLRTEEFIGNIVTRIAFVGGIYLALLCVVPDFLFWGIRMQHVPVVGDWIDGALLSSHVRWMATGLGVHVYFCGEMALVATMIAMDFVDRIEALLIMRHFEGFALRSGHD